MGREIRRVPPHWQHPRKDNGEYQPAHNESYSEACETWKREYEEWKTAPKSDCEYWEWAGTPDRDYCRPEFTEEPTWFQVYETVSEGTPVTPPFATEDELIDHLARCGDDWDQRRGDRPPSREACEKFVRAGSAPSMVIGPSGLKMGIESCEDMR